jgi:hypothetical protein
MNITLYMSGVPTTPSGRLQYFNYLEVAMVSILNISAEWRVKVGEISTSRRVDLSGDAAVCTVFTSSTADATAVALLRNKLESQAFLDALNGLGFLASQSRQQPTTASVGSNGLQPPVIICVGLASGILSVFLFLFLYRRLSRCKLYSKGNGKSGSAKDGLEESASEAAKDDALCLLWTDQGPAHGKYIPDRIHADTEMASSFLFDRDRMNGADYSIELEEVLQLLAELGIGIKSLLDARSRKDIEVVIQNSDNVSAHNCAAMLQLLSKIEIEEDLSVLTSDRLETLQQRICKGPFTENHSVVLKLVCESERDIAIHTPSNKAPDTADEPVPDVPARSNLSSIPAEAAPKEERSDQALAQVTLLLKRCELKLSYLLRSESRKVIEDSLTNRDRGGQLLPEHLAVLQLISKAEIDSDVSIDPARRRLLEERIQCGPLSANHLGAARSLAQTAHAEGTEQLAGAEARVLPHWGFAALDPAQVQCSEVLSRTQLAGAEACEALHDDVLQAGPQSSAVQESTTAPIEQTTPRDEVIFAEADPSVTSSTGAALLFKEISGLETSSSLLSNQEKAALQLIELRAKTACIRQSLPDWVKKGLVPPRRNLSPPVTSLGQQLLQIGRAAERASGDPHNAHTTRDALQISCEVRADIGFLSNLLQPAARAKSHLESMERRLFGEELPADASASAGLNSPSPSARQAGAAPLPDEGVPNDMNLAGHGSRPRREPTPLPSPSLMARLLGAVAHLVSRCAEAVFSVCSGWRRAGRP